MRRAATIVRFRLTSVVLALAVGVGVVLPAGASAQDGPVTAHLDAVGAWASAESLRRLLPDGRSAGRESRRSSSARARPRRATAAQLRKLRFRRSATVTRRNQQAVVDRLPGHDPAVVVADLERNRAAIHRMMRGFRGSWSPNDLADVAAVTLLSSYAAFHDRFELSGKGSLAVRSAARHALARRAKVRRLSPARKQTAAEMTEIRLIYALTRLNAARASRADDPHSFAAARYEIRTFVRDVYGLDVQRVRLTSRGFR
jgi:hypothetical protein